MGWIAESVSSPNIREISNVMVVGRIACILLILRLTTAWAYDITVCPEFPSDEMFVSGMVGYCYRSPCSSRLGPTECQDEVCYCKTGYCAYPSRFGAARLCAARITNATCYNSKNECSGFGGAEATVCDKGFCMCRPRYQYNAKTRKCIMELSSHTVPPGIQNSQIVTEADTEAQVRELHTNVNQCIFGKVLDKLAASIIR